MRGELLQIPHHQISPTFTANKNQFTPGEVFPLKPLHQPPGGYAGHVRRVASSLELMSCVREAKLTVTLFLGQLLLVPHLVLGYL